MKTELTKTHAVRAHGEMVTTVQLKGQGIHPPSFLLVLPPEIFLYLQRRSFILPSPWSASIL